MAALGELLWGWGEGNMGSQTVYSTRYSCGPPRCALLRALLLIPNQTCAGRARPPRLLHTFRSADGCVDVGGVPGLRFLLPSPGWAVGRWPPSRCICRTWQRSGQSGRGALPGWLRTRALRGRSLLGSAPLPSGG